MALHRIRKRFALVVGSPFETGMTIGWLAAGWLLWGLFGRGDRSAGPEASPRRREAASGATSAANSSVRSGDSETPPEVEASPGEVRRETAPQSRGERVRGRRGE